MGGPAKVLNLTNPAGNQSVASAVVWSANQLLDAPHTVVVSMAPGGTFVEVNVFIYSSDSNSTIPSQSPNPTGSSSSTTPTSISTISGSYKNIGAAAGGSVAGLAIIAVIGFLLFWKPKESTSLSGIQIDARNSGFYVHRP